jgi:hypothetical protein
MADREKVINELVEHIESALAVDSDYVDCVRTDLLQTVVGLLKEQEVTEQISDAIHETAKQFRQTIVRCKDCQHCYFASNRIPCEQSLTCAKTGRNITPDWFCADGRKVGEVNGCSNT